MCPPGHTSARDPYPGRHTGRPLQILLQHPSTSGQWAGTEPRPYSRRMPNAGSRSTGPSSTSSPASQNARNDSRHQSLHLPSPVPTSFVPESPVTPGWFPKEGPQPFLWSFQGGSGREIRNPSQNLSWEARGDILLIRKEYPLASRRPSSAAPHARQGGNLRRHAESSCPTGG